MRRLLLTYALLAVMVLPVMVSASTKTDRAPEGKQSTEQPASVSGETGQRRRVESTSQATDATTSRDMSDALRQSINQYNEVNPTVND
jgi:hypothetical protein